MSLIRSHFEKEYGKKWFKIIRDNHNKGLNWNKISSNKLLSFEMVLENLHFPWNWNEFCRNKNFTIEEITLIVNILLDTNNNKISSETIQNILDNGGWKNNKINISQVSCNKTLTTNVMPHNLTPSCDLKSIKNQNLTTEHQSNYLNFDNISCNKTLTTNIMPHNLTSSCDLKSIKNQNLTTEIATNHLNSHDISSSKKLTKEEYDNYVGDRPVSCGEWEDIPGPPP